MLQGFWPDWEPNQAEYKVWARKLDAYDYRKAERAIGDWLSEQSYQGKTPKLGKVLTALSSRNATVKMPKPEAVKVYELFDQDNPSRRQSFWSRSEIELKSRTEHSYETEAEHKRSVFNAIYGGNWVVIQDWKRYFNERAA